MRPKGIKNYTPTAEVAEQVKNYAAFGITQEDMAKVLKISIDTLQKYYSESYNEGIVHSNNNIGKRLYKKALDGDTASMIFWLKTRARWSEKTTIELTGKDGGPVTTFDATKLSNQTLKELLAVRRESQCKE